MDPLDLTWNNMFYKIFSWMRPDTMNKINLMNSFIRISCSFNRISPVIIEDNGLLESEEVFEAHSEVNNISDKQSPNR